MEPHKWTNILTLFSVVILADGRVYKEEVDTFVERTLALKETISPKMIYSKKMAMDWFFLHRDEIIKWARGIDPQEHAKRHVMALGDSPFCEEILDALYAVAIVDGDYHHAESKLISLACEYWNLPTPGQG
ncbi:tellurite resistance TerB family protein [Hellea balneolensis]|uniref:tellurite resistance TerB family protein n=1 Tax=Hellea balneolensis TaxID=287478 RepID=UPI0004787F83|nr:TerB family tellurite resistance protein [Hellea balneolensis]